MNIPLLNLKREYSFLKKDIDSQIRRCLSSQQWILGKSVEEFEKRAAKYLGTKYAVGVSSGTDALILSLCSLAYQRKGKILFDKNDEIITTPFTFIATAEAIKRAGARPVFVDIDKETLNIDPQAIKKSVNKKTAGILPVHLYGRACEIDKICKIAKDNNLFVLEDAAQSFGANFSAKGGSASGGSKKAGSWGNLGAFSFFPSKNLGAFGDGGLISTDSKQLYSFLKILRNHGQASQYNARFLGFNSRLDSIQAGVLLAKLKHIDEFNQRRIKIAKIYNDALSGIKYLILPQSSNPHYQSSRPDNISHLYTVKVPAKIRNRLVKYLNSQGIAARIYYPLGLHKMKAFSDAVVPFKLKNTEKFAGEVLSLPLHPFLTKRELNYIISRIKNFFHNL